MVENRVAGHPPGMGIAVSLIIAAVGLILALAVHSTSSSIDVSTVGWILFIVGLIGLVIDLLLWSPMGPGYLRRRTDYVEGVAPAYPARRRRVVEEVDDPAAPPPGY